MGRITSTSPGRLRSFAYTLAALAALLGVAGVFAPVTRGAVPPAPAPYHFLVPVSIGENIGLSLVAFPLLVLVALAIDLRRPGVLRWASLLLGSVMALAVSGWLSTRWYAYAVYGPATHWEPYRVDDGSIHPGIRVALHPGPGMALYALGGMIAVTLGALAILRPRWVHLD